ncbi:MAG: gamma-butyrobetaine hydroxylase-like domain-containing protein [Chthoniobacterales bacterium]
MQALQPTNIQLIGSELAMAWSDGAETFFELQDLRRACPCAACNGETDVMGDVERPQKEYTSRSFELAGYEFVGGYGFQPRWGDGHSTGIYSFAYLRKLAEVG